MVSGRGFSVVLLCLAVGVISGCTSGIGGSLDAESDRELDTVVSQWVETARKRSDKGVSDAARLTEEIVLLEEKLTAARAELAKVAPRTARRFSEARSDAGPRPTDRRAADTWANALDEKLATIASNGEHRKLQAEKKVAGISRQIDTARRSLGSARQYIRTPEQLAAEGRRYKALLVAIDREGAWQLQQRIDELNFVNVDLYEVVDRLGDYGNIAVGWRALATAGAEFDKPITYKRRNVKLGEALETLFALASGNHYSVTVGSLGNVVVVSTPQDIKNSARLYARTAAQVAASPYKANRNMMAEKLSRLEFVDIEFSLALQFMEEVVERKIRIDWDALKRYDVTPETPITVHSIRRPTFALLIRLLLDQAGGGKVMLDVEVKKGDIIIKPLVAKAENKQIDK
jgi:hypothetical protein